MVLLYSVIVCDRFREKVESHLLEFENSQFHITISIGISPYKALKRKLKPTVTDLIAAADKALYRAKEAGRNRVVVYSE